MKSFNRQNGIALLEVLIAFVIVTISAVALYQLQNKYLRNEIASSARLTALNLAESKLDDLRTFGSLTVSGSVPAYDNIDTDQGGTIASGDVSVGNFKYERHWTVTDAGDGSLDIKVTVSWNNGNDEVSLFGSMARADRISEARLISTGAIKDYSPHVVYTPGVAPDVISIDLGNGSKQETTKPLPEVANSGGSIQSQFSTITYDTDSNTQVQSDFTTVSCSCNFASAKASTLLPAYPYLTDNDLLYWNVGSAATKTTGSSATKTQSTLCSVCCENHFDDNTSGESGKFVGYYNQLNRNAAKFRYNGSYSTATSGDYIDSCRLLRINGFYKPMPDWNLVKLNVMSAGYLSDTDNVKKYQAYIKDVVTAYVSLMKNSTLWGSSTTNRGVFKIGTDNVDTSGIPSFADWLKSKEYSTTDLTMKIGDTPLQLISRGIFVDFLSNEDTTTDTTLGVGDITVSDSDVLKKVPFYDINMTLLSRWESTTPAAVTVANEVIKTLDSEDIDYYGVYRRGYITPITVTASGGVPITATAYQGNSSVAAYQYSKNNTEIAVSDFESNYARSGSINITVSSSAVSDGTVSIIGKIYCYDAKNNGGTASCKQGQTNYLSNISIQGTAASCQLESVANETSYLLYNCKVTPPATNSRVSVSTSATGFMVSPSSARDLSLELNGTTSPVTGKCFNVYSNKITVALPTTCPYP